MSQPQHDDPLGEARGRALQVLAVAATVGEAAARWAAVGVQNRAGEAERDAANDEATRAAQRLANEAQLQQDRRLIDHGLTDWLRRATVEETVRLWRTATVHAASGNARAAQAAGLAQERLRQMNGPLMDAYDRHRASGMGAAEAMKAAAYEMWEQQARAYQPPNSNGRPHGGPEPEQLRAGAAGRALPGGPGMLNELDAAVRAEAGQLAAHISPEALDRLQREWRAAGRAPAADAAQLLAQVAQEAADRGDMPPAAVDALGASLTAHADTQRRAAALDNATPDDTRTGDVDEHQHGQDHGRVYTDVADGDLAAAGARQRSLMSQAFPPLTGVGKMPAQVANKRPANATPSQRQGRTR